MRGKGRSALSKQTAIEQNLKAAGCDSETIEKCLCDLKADRPKRLLQRLSRHRKNLVSEVHEKEKCIDCLDYLVYDLERKD